MDFPVIILKLSRKIVSVILPRPVRFSDDWRSPGACYAAVLPEDLSPFHENHQLKLMPIQIGMLKNHGYSLLHKDGYDAAVVGCEEGVYVFNPPAAAGEPWKIDHILSVPTSDAVLMDFDGDGLDGWAALRPSTATPWSSTIWMSTETMCPNGS